MDGFDEFLIKNIHSGRISEIVEITEKFFGEKAGDLSPETKADICVM